ncbi:MAG: DUF2182 domain-containing protein [Acidobacteriota bacterium]
MRNALAWREAMWSRPEWWVVGMGGVSWWLMLRDAVARSAHASHHHTTVGSEIVAWHVMVLAMMLPSIALTARSVALRTRPGWRHPAIAACLVSYLLPWSAFGITMVAIRNARWIDSPWTVASLCAVATAWAILPVRERAMMHVHGYAPVVAPDGWRTLRDCTATGLIVGATCILSCWPLMLACLFSGHDLALISAGGVIGLVESRSFRPPKRLVIAVTAALTVFAAVR